VIDGFVTADRLYFVTLKKKPRSSPTVHYFSTDDEFFYNRLLTFLSCLQMKTMLDVNEVVLALRFGVATVRVCHSEGYYQLVTQIQDKLQRVLNSAARIISNTHKFDRGLTHFRRSPLHWLDVVDRVRFRVCIQVFRCLHKMAPEYLSTYCQPVSGISGRHYLRSVDRGHIDFPCVKLASYGGRSFAYADPSNWNSLPVHLRDNSLSLSSFRRHLKTFLFFSTRLAHAARLGFFFLQKCAI